MGTVWGYARVSTDEQDGAGQRHALERYGVPLDRVCLDAGVSGDPRRRKTRPAWTALTGQLQPGDTLVVTKMDRLSRSVIELLRTAEELQERGVDLVILELGVDTRTPAGRLVYTVMAGLAEFELETIRGRTRDALAAKKARGELVGRRRSLSPVQRQHAAELRAMDKSYPEIGAVLGVSAATVWRELNLRRPA